MASPENDSKKISQTSESPTGDPPEPESIRRDLEKLARGYCADRRLDALCLFLKVHRCIFDRIASSHFPQMVALNPLFARKFSDVCREFIDGGDFQNGPRLWIYALDFYITHPSDVFRALVLMAKAHILEDLPNSLYDLEASTGCSIDRVEFDGALDSITGCLEEMSRGVTGAENILDYLYFSIAPHFVPVREIQKVQVRQLRQAAWDEYLIHKRFALNQRLRKHGPDEAPAKVPDKAPDKASDKK